MTLGDFETAKRVPVTSTDSRIRDITQAAFDLTEQLEITFESCTAHHGGSIQSLMLLWRSVRAGRGVVLAYVLLRQGSNLFGR